MYQNTDQFQMDIEKERQKSAIRIQEKLQKDQIDANNKLYLEEQRFIKKEQQREYRAALYDDLYINHDGTVHVVTRNSIINATPKTVFNFIEPRLTRLVCTDGSDDFVKLTFKIRQNPIELYLEKTKLSSAKYVFSKMYTVGVSVAVKKDSDAAQMIYKLISLLMIDAPVEIIPEHEGWCKMPDDKYVFVRKEELTWEKLKRKAR